MLKLINAAEKGVRIETQKGDPERRIVVGRSWKDVVINKSNEGAQGNQGADVEFATELCCGNCGWKLRGTLRTISDKQRPLNSLDIRKDAQEGDNAEPHRKQAVDETQKLELESRSKVNKIRREEGQPRISKSVSFRKNTSLIGSISKKRPFINRVKEGLDRRRKNVGVTGKYIDVEEREKHTVNQEVHRWVQKHTPGDTQETEASKGGGRDDRMLQVYRRRGISELRRGNKDGGIVLREQTSVRKHYEPSEYVNKLKGILENDSLTEAESEQEEQVNRDWVRGECSNREFEDELALIPIYTEVDASSERSSQVSKQSNMSTTSNDIWETIRGTTLEEQARIWIMSNILLMGKKLGLCLDGKKAEVLNLANEFEGRSITKEDANTRTKCSSKSQREINRLKSNVNYEGKGSKRARKLSKIGKFHREGVFSC